MDKAKVQSALEHAVADFVNRESNRRSLITVTRVQVDDRGLHARVFVSVYPDSQAKAALDFLSRTTEDLRTFVKSHVSMHTVPHFIYQQDPNIAGLGVEEVHKG